MSWQIYIGLSVILYSLSVLLQRILVKDNSRPVAFSVLFQVGTGLILTVVGFVFADMTLPNLVPLLGNLVLMILLYGLGNVLMFRSLEHTEASVFTIFFATRALFTIGASSLLLQEALTLKQLMGAAFIFLAVVLVSWKSQKIRLGTGELLALAAAACFGLANTNDRYLLQSFSLYSYLSIAFIIPAVLTAASNPKEMKYIPIFFQGKALRNMLLLCMIYAVSSLAFFKALQVADNSSQVAAINLTSVIVIVLLSVAFLREREHTIRKIVGACICFIGLLLVT